MDNNYFNEFDSKEVNFNSLGINLKRNKFIYETIDYKDVKEIRIFRGFLLKNRLVVIFGALGIIWLGYNVLNKGYTMLYDQELTTMDWIFQFLNRGSIISIWGPLMLIAVGIIAIYNTFVKSYIAKIETDKKIYYPRIKEIEKRHEIELLMGYLKTKNVKLYKEST